MNRDTDWGAVIGIFFMILFVLYVAANLALSLYKGAL